MASKDELRAMGIEVKECKECCRHISEEEYKKYKGYCKNCYEEKQNIERSKREYNNEDDAFEEKYYDNNKNTVATIIKGIAIISAIAGFIVGLVSIDELNSGIMAVVIIVASIISAVFVYALGEIIQKLQNIENNTNNLKDKINNEIPKL